MFDGREAVEELVTHLATRPDGGACIFHACQARDFASYLEIGGIPSRSCLESTKLAFTVFDTDAKDHLNGVWEKAFVNLDDFGTSFATGSRSTPNPYGPILFQMRPEVLRAASDVAVCLRSAGGRDFDRGKESLSTIDEINRLYEAGSSRVKYSSKIKEEFGADAHAPELSCTAGQGFLPFRGHIAVVLVDPLQVNGVELLGWVRATLDRFALTDVPARPRSYPHSHNRQHVYRRLQDCLASGRTTFEQLAACTHDQALTAYSQQIKAQRLEYQFDRWASYLVDGTRSYLATVQ